MGIFHGIFAWMCRRVFKQVDYNKDGRIDPLEVEVAVLHLYGMANKRLPGWQDPPSRESIQASLRAFDANSDGSLNEEEFIKFARSLTAAGPDQFFARVGKDAILKTALLPALSVGVKSSVGAVANVPLAVLAPAMGVFFSAVRALVPV